MEPEKLIAAVVAALLGLLPMLTNAVISQVDKRSKAGRVDKAIDLAKRRIEFSSQWYQARLQFDTQERINEIKEELAKEFDEIKKFVETEMAVPLVAANLPVDRKQSRFQRLFLLYLPKSLLGWLYHTLFYIFFAIFILFGFLTISDIFSYGFTEFGIDVTLMIMPFLPALLFSFLANSLERKLAKESENNK